MNSRDNNGRRRDRYGLWLIAGAALFWGTGGIAGKLVLVASSLDPIEVGFYRLAIAAPVLLTAGLALRRGLIRPIAVRDLAAFAALSLATASYQLCFYQAVVRAGVSLATLIALCGAPPIVAIGAGLTLGEPTDRRTRLAMAMTLAGTVLLVGWPAGGGSFTDQLAGGALAAAAAASYAGMVLFSRGLAARYSAFQMIAVGFGGGALILLPMVLWRGFSPIPDLSVGGLILFLGLVPTALAYSLFFLGIRRAAATAVSIVSLLEPLIATVLGMALFAERLGVAGFAGMAMMLGGMIVLSVRPA